MSNPETRNFATPMSRFYGVIPAGGVGTRLWPLSRASAPKFLHDLTGSGSTLIRATYERLSGLCDNRMLVVTGVSHRAAVTKQLPEISEENIILESQPKDSAAAIGLAAAILYTRDPDLIMGSFAADQVIKPVDEFQRVVTEAVETAATGKIVTIGITPDYPSTGFGYIRQGEPLGLEQAPHAHDVVEFVEKPDENTARAYLETGEYSWNAGMFVAPVKLMLSHLEANQPVLYAGLMEIAEAWGTDEQAEVTARVWPTLPKIAIDYAVAEPAAAAGDVAVVPGSFDWDDVGDFAAMARLNHAADNESITIVGDSRRVYSDKSSGGIVVSETNRVIALIGIDDVVVVDTHDALLVTTKEHAQSVKAAVAHWQSQGDTDVL